VASAQLVPERVQALDEPDLRHAPPALRVVREECLQAVGEVEVLPVDVDAVLFDEAGYGLYGPRARGVVAEVKQHVKRTDPAALVAYTAAVHGVPALVEALGLKRAPMLANLVISNPFGMPERRYLAGAEVESALGLSLLTHGQSLNISAVTYDKGLQVLFLASAPKPPARARSAVGKATQTAA